MKRVDDVGVSVAVFINTKTNLICTYHAMRTRSCQGIWDWWQFGLPSHYDPEGFHAIAMFPTFFFYLLKNIQHRHNLLRERAEWKRMRYEKLESWLEMLGRVSMRSDTVKAVSNAFVQFSGQRAIVLEPFVSAKIIWKRVKVSWLSDSLLYKQT